MFASGSLRAVGWGAKTSCNFFQRLKRRYTLPGNRAFRVQSGLSDSALCLSTCPNAVLHSIGTTSTLLSRRTEPGVPCPRQGLGRFVSRSRCMNQSPSRMESIHSNLRPASPWPGAYFRSNANLTQREYCRLGCSGVAPSPKGGQPRWGG